MRYTTKITEFANTYEIIGSDIKIVTYGDAKAPWFAKVLNGRTLAEFSCAANNFTAALQFVEAM